MARQEQDREDLLREATALAERIELAIGDFPEPVVVGFRRSGCASFFFGGDPVFQFNSQGALRRGFLAGRLLKAERRQLEWVDRQRDGAGLSLHAAPLSVEEQNAVIGVVERHLATLRGALRDCTARILGQVPPSGNLVPRIAQWLADHGDRIVIADRPHAV
jgi:hypothetical protein